MVADSKQSFLLNLLRTGASPFGTDLGQTHSTGVTATVASGRVDPTDTEVSVEANDRLALFERQQENEEARPEPCPPSASATRTHSGECCEPLRGPTDLAIKTETATHHSFKSAVHHLEQDRDTSGEEVQRHTTIPSGLESGSSADSPTLVEPASDRTPPHPDDHSQTVQVAPDLFVKDVAGTVTHPSPRCDRYLPERACDPSGAEAPILSEIANGFESRSAAYPTGLVVWTSNKTPLAPDLGRQFDSPGELEISSQPRPVTDEHTRLQGEHTYRDTSEQERFSNPPANSKTKVEIISQERRGSRNVATKDANSTGEQSFLATPLSPMPVRPDHVRASEGQREKTWTSNGARTPRLTIHRLEVRIINQEAAPAAATVPSVRPARTSANDWESLHRHHLSRFYLSL